MAFSIDNNKIILKDELINMVPHKGKMFLLNRVMDFSVEEKWICTQVDVSKDSIFYDENYDGIPSWCTFEMMAQSIAAFSSILDKFTEGSENKKIKPGVVLSVSKFNANVPCFKIESKINIKMIEDSRDDEVIKYYGELYSEENDEEPCVTSFVTVMEMESL